MRWRLWGKWAAVWRPMKCGDASRGEAQTPAGTSKASGSLSAAPGHKDRGIGRSPPP